MAFRKVIVILSGSGATGMVKLSGSFDGMNKVKGECACEAAKHGSKLYIIGSDVAEVNVENMKTQFEVPICAKGGVSCLLKTEGKTLVGSTEGRADRRALESRVELYKREKIRAARAKEKVVCAPPSEHFATPSEHTLAQESSPSRERSDASSSTGSPAADGKAETPCERVRTSAAEGGNNALGSSPAEAPFAPSPLSGGKAEPFGGVRYDGTNFYQAIKPQIDELFVRYPAEPRLNAIVPNSKWVRVDTDADDYYVVGVLFDLSLPIFVCYGVPGVRTVPPPEEIADAGVWLPLDSRNPDGEGFWMIYQSAADGKCIR